MMQAGHIVGKVEYREGDARVEMPTGPFDNVSWDAGIEYFSLNEIEEILDGIKLRLVPGGILSGYSILVPESERGTNAGQKYAASSQEDLGELLERHFRNVTILRTRSSDRYHQRTNHYFFASDGPLPFGEDWPDLKRWGA